MSVVVTICLAVLALSGALFLLRALRPASLPDRLIGMDGLLLVIACGVIVSAVGSGEGTFLDVAVVVSLVGFTGTVTVARYIEQRGSR